LHALGELTTLSAPDLLLTQPFIVVVVLWAKTVPTAATPRARAKITDATATSLMLNLNCNTTSLFPMPPLLERRVRGHPLLF